LTAPPTRFERGFHSGDAKLAFLHGDITAAVPLPDGLLEVLRGREPDRGAVAEERHWKNLLLITQAAHIRTL
jgi:hypothetical protein